MKRVLKKTARTSGIAVLSILSITALYFLMAFSCACVTVREEVNGEPTIPVYIKTNGVHTDIVVPVQAAGVDWSKEIKYEHISQKSATYQFLAFGWGDKGFYLQTPDWADLKLSVAFNAIFWRSTTAIHATYYQNISENKRCRKLMLNEEQYGRLVQFIRGSFRKDTNGHFEYIPTNANYCATDAFYEGTGRYSMLMTCNTWANNALKASGQRCCLWTIFDTGIFDKYK